MKKINFHKLLVVAAFATVAGGVFATSNAPTTEGQSMDHARYGGEVYLGEPDLNATSGFVRAGGGEQKFTIEQAFQEMMGDKWTRDEIRHLTEMYGRSKVHTWSIVSAFAYKDAVHRMADANIQLPDTGLRGHGLATALVNDGVGKEDRFTSEKFCDMLVSHGVHERVMDDVDKEYGADADGTFHQITNQAFFDMAQALQMIKVMRAGFH